MGAEWVDGWLCVCVCVFVCACAFCVCVCVCVLSDCVFPVDPELSPSTDAESTQKELREQLGGDDAVLLDDEGEESIRALEHVSLPRPAQLHHARC
jgi:hypothetical protein